MNTPHCSVDRPCQSRANAVLNGGSQIYYELTLKLFELLFYDELVIFTVKYCF